MKRKVPKGFVGSLVPIALVLMFSLLPGGAQAATLFGPKTDFVTGGGSVSVAIGDLNEDGHPDLVVGNSSSMMGNDPTVSVLLGNGDGTFGPKTDFAAGGQDPSSNGGYKFVAIGDLDEDGHLDLAVAAGNNHIVSVLLGNSDGTFDPKTDFATGYGPYFVAIGDLNGDGHLDLVTANAGDNTVSVLIGNGTGTFAIKVDYATGVFPRSIAIGDLNGDGHLDLVTANSNGNNSTVSVLLGNGDGTFATKVDYVTGSWTWSVAIGDLDGDGKPDLVVANEATALSTSPWWTTGTVSILLNGGTFQAPFALSFLAQVDYVMGSNPNFVTIGDVNGDGKLDIATTSDGYPYTVSVSLGNGDGTFASSVSFTTGAEPKAVAIGDVNGDGKPDLVVVNRGGIMGSGSVSILLNTTVFPDTTPPETAIISAVDGCGAAVTSGESSLSSSITFTFSGTDDTTPSNDLTFECSLDNAAFSTCTSPATYTGLAAGTHSFQVQAVDAAGNVDPSPATFNWTILTPAQATQNLIAQVQSLVPPLNQGQANSLIAKLNAAILQLNNGNPNTAVNQLNAFINQVNGFMNGNNPKLTQAQGQPLIAAAQAIINAILGC